jgi:T5SS/PEP-CTERM-associated repeat protein
LVTVDGAASIWTNSSSLNVGGSGIGTLNIADGGAVAATNVSINSASLLAIDVASGSRLNAGNGTGTITNNGKVRILAGANASAGTYAPILATTWSGTGIYQAIGGTWNADHTFTASAVQTGAAGETITLNGNQRVLITDSETGNTGWSVGASFAADSTPMTLTASVISGDVRTGLESLLDGDQIVLGGWEFTLDDGYTEGQPAYLSFDIGADHSRDELQVWHYDTTTGWTEYEATDLTYNGDYASFTVTGFSGYAVTGVPEPGALSCLPPPRSACWSMLGGRAGIGDEESN